MVTTHAAMLTRFLRLQLGKVHHRLFLLEEYLRGCRGRRMPAHLMRQIMRRPADAEDWVHLLRFVGPEEPVFLVDVGAHVGDFTHGFLACYQDAEVVLWSRPARPSIGSGPGSRHTLPSPACTTRPALVTATR